MKRRARGAPVCLRDKTRRSPKGEAVERRAAVTQRVREIIDFIIVGKNVMAKKMNVESYRAQTNEEENERN
jgi:hypothetical protein